MTRLENKLTAALYRITCPEPAELGEYYFDLLAETRATLIRQHLATCPHCTREVAQLKAYLAELSPDVEHSLADRIKIWIARLIPEAPVTGLAPSFALRGDGNGGPQVYEAGEAQLTIETQDDPGRPGQKSILGLVLGIETAGLQATVWQDGRAIATTGVDELGNFVFTTLPPGQYELILAGPDVEIHVQSLAI